MKKALVIAAAVVRSFLTLPRVRRLSPAAGLGRRRRSGRLAQALAQAAPRQVESLTPPPANKQRLSGIVVDDRTAAPLPGATVLVNRAAGGSHATTVAEDQAPPIIVVADAAGRFTLDLSAGHFYVDANHPGYTSTKPATVEIETENVDRVELRLQPRRIRVHGTITDFKGGPVAAAIVTAEAAPGEIPPDGSRPRSPATTAATSCGSRSANTTFAPSTQRMRRDRPPDGGKPRGPSRSRARAGRVPSKVSCAAAAMAARSPARSCSPTASRSSAR